MDLDGRTRQFFSVLSERLKEKGFSSRIADDGCLAVKSKKMRGKEQTQCSVGKDGEVYMHFVRSLANMGGGEWHEKRKLHCAEM